mgnify:CR=1 FL=1
MKFKLGDKVVAVRCTYDNLPPPTIGIVYTFERYGTSADGCGSPPVHCRLIERGNVWFRVEDFELAKQEDFTLTIQIQYKEHKI